MWGVRVLLFPLEGEDMGEVPPSLALRILLLREWMDFLGEGEGTLEVSE